MFTITMVALAMLTGYAASHVGIPPVAMAALVSCAAFLGEIVRRLTYRALLRRR